LTDEALVTDETTAPAEVSETPSEQNSEIQAHDHSGHTHSHAPSLNPELRREVALEVPANVVSKTFAKVTKRYGKMARIPGFRTGKVPDSLIRARFAKEVRQEVMEALVQERFRDEMQAQNLNPISQPQIIELNLLDGQPMRFRAEFEIAPQINVDGYESVTVDKPNVTVEDNEYQAELDRVLESHGTVEPIEEDRPLQDGDWAEIKFVGKRRETDGGTPDPSIEERTEDVQGDDVLVEVGGKNTLPAFTDALRGKKAGDQFSVEVDYPKEFGDLRLAGQTVNYDVTVVAMKKKTFPERNEEFAKQLGDFDTWDAFESSLRESVTNRKKQIVEQEAKSKLVDALVEKFSFPVPESFVQQQVDVRLDRGLRALAQQGMPEEQMRQLDFVRLREAQRDEALKEVKASLLLDTIAQKADVQVNEEDVQRELMMASMQSRQPYEQLRERMQNDGSLQRMREQMRREQTATMLYEKMA
jgi:trigger factor